MGMDVAAAAQPFVGRDRQLRDLETAAALAAGGQGCLLLLAGEPGIGKTRLATELAARCRAAGTGVLWASCWEGDGAPAFWPWIQVIRAHASGRDPATLAGELGPGAAEIARLVPELARAVPDLPAPAAVDPQEARFHVYDSVTSFLRGLGAGRPHLVVLDDLHWADEPSLQLLRFLARELRDSGLLVLGTYRDVEVDSEHSLARLLGELPGGAQLLRLDGLSRDEVRELIAAQRGTGEPDRELVRSVHDRTAGNPFFVREVLRLAEGDAAAGAVPGGVRAVIGRRLGQLGDPCRELLEAASIVGIEFPVALLCEVVRQPSRPVLALLEEALAARLVEQAPDGVLRFSHALVREVLQGRLPPRAQRDLHRRVGAAIELRHGGEVDGLEAELALHYRMAGEPDDLARALAYSERAARRSLRLHAHEDAAVHLRRALELLELAEPGDRSRRCELLLTLGEAEMAAGQVPIGRRSLERAATVAREIGAPRLLARAALGMGGEFAAGAADDVEVSLLEEALRAVGDGDPALRARLMAWLARALLFSPLLERRSELAEEATRIARGLGDPPTLGAVLCASHQALAANDTPEDRLRMTDEIAELAELAGDRTLALRGAALRLGDLVELGEMDRFRADLDRYARDLNELRQLSSLWQVPLQRAHVAALAGQFEEAERLAAEVLSLGGEIQHRGIDVFHATVVSITRFLQGRLPDLIDSYRLALRSHPGLLSFRAGLAVALAEAGRDEEARDEFERLAAAGFRDIPRDFLWPHNFALLALTCHHLGDGARAQLLYEQLLPRAPYNVLLTRLGGTMGSIQHYLGLLAAAMSRWDVAVEHLEAAVASHVRQGFLPLLANSRHQLAAVLLRRGGAGDAARAAVEEEGARSLARSLGIRLILEDRAGPAPVTGRASLRQEGELWTLDYEGRRSVLRDAVGLRLLARLLREPNREFHVLDLGSPRGRAQPTSDAGPVLDEHAKAQYKRRLQELAEDIEEAEAWGDPERGARARREADLLTEQLVRAVGLGGRDRRVASDAERARVSVTKALRTAVRRVADQEAELGAHLAVSVRTGSFCAYCPDPASAVVWTL